MIITPRMRLRPCLSALATPPVLLWLLATAGCTTPVPVKTLSTSVVNNQPSLASLYSEDLVRFQNFHLLMGTTLDQLAGDALGQQAALKVVARQILLERVQFTRSNVLARFDQKALQVLSKDFTAEMDRHFRPQISGREAVYLAEYQAAREQVLLNPGSAPAQRAHAKAIYTLAEFRRLALEAELTQHSSLAEKIQQLRGELVQSLDAEFGKYAVTGQPGASLTNLIQTAQEGAKSTAFLTQMTTNAFAFQAQLLALKEYQNKLAIALARLDEYLQTDAYLAQRGKNFFQGFMSAFGDLANIQKGIDVLAMRPDVSGVLSKFGLQDVLKLAAETQEKLPKSEESLGKTADTLIAKLEDSLVQGVGQKLSDVLRGNPGAGADPAAGTK